MGGLLELVRRTTVVAAVAGVAVLAPTVIGNASTSDYTLNYSSGHVIRWNPCKSIHYRVNLDRAPSGALAEVKDAVSRVAARTDISFVFDGKTDRLPQANWTQHVSRSQRLIVFAWAAAGSGDGHSTLLPSGAAGEGGWTAQAWTEDGQAHALRIVGGFAIFDPKTYRGLRDGFGRGQTQGQLILHELGHAMGLNHTSNRGQIMYPQLLSRDDTSYGAGDRTGLSRVGRDAGCIN